MKRNDKLILLGVLGFFLLTQQAESIVIPFLDFEIPNPFAPISRQLQPLLASTLEAVSFCAVSTSLITFVVGISILAYLMRKR